MDNSPFINYLIEERSFVAFIKREIHNAAMQASFTATRVGVIDLVVSELTSNLIKHAIRGELLYRFMKESDSPVFEILSIDNGPGIKDISHSMKDGITTTKTLGQGLGSLERLSNCFQMYSIPGWGTICYSKIFAHADQEAEPAEEIRIKALNVAKPGERESGDGFYVQRSPRNTRIFMGDGLGHGREAKEAVQKAIDVFKACRETTPSNVLRAVHAEVKRTRGLVGTVAIIDQATRKWQICGIGNIATRMYEGLSQKNYISYNGIIGMNIPGTLNDHVLDLARNQCIVMTSDGIRTRWDISQFPGILRYDPIMLAAALYKDYARKTDDMSILIGRT